MTDAQLSALAQAQKMQDFTEKVLNFCRIWPRIHVCPACEGSGDGSDRFLEPCRLCNGKGFLTTEQMEAWSIGDC